MWVFDQIAKVIRVTYIFYDIIIIEVAMGWMPIVRASAVQVSGGHFQPTGAAHSVCFTGKVAEANDIQDCTGKEFLKKVNFPSWSCN